MLWLTWLRQQCLQNGREKVKKGWKNDHWGVEIVGKEKKKKNHCWMSWNKLEWKKNFDSSLSRGSQRKKKNREQKWVTVSWWDRMKQKRTTENKLNKQTQKNQKKKSKKKRNKKNHLLQPKMLSFIPKKWVSGPRIVSPQNKRKKKKGQQLVG